MALKLKVIDTTLGPEAREIEPGVSIYDRVFDMAVQPWYMSVNTMAEFNAVAENGLPVYLGQNKTFHPRVKAGRWPLKLHDDPEIWLIGNNHARIKVRVVD